MPGKFDDHDWDELPADVQKAAGVLGYNKEVWDSDGKTEFEEYDWEELDAEQQAAAVALGYTKASWDE